MPRYIDADALVEMLEDWMEQMAEERGLYDPYCCCLDKVIDKIDFFPDADLVSEYMKHYKQGLADAEARRKGELMQAFDPD